MDYPPWLPKPDLSKRGLVLALARCIHDAHYRKEPHRTKGHVWVFDNLNTGDLEGAARILQKAGFTEFNDKIGRYSVFTCTPVDFENVADAMEAGCGSLEDSERAVVRLATGNLRSSPEIEGLSEMILGNT
ncbi:hypothetical protein KMP13_09650 [Epibacterium ulvae]|uniref:hypothetical protein n=1 Tax=Epibacterium ulvae TaxID=1156985 RepID=UPI001BFCA4B0|nr:hypothetical protein [Epibacterium ulvae]MBT8154154.1 hypothetical protein [Epibacterium ulvae]